MCLVRREKIRDYRMKQSKDELRRKAHKASSRSGITQEELDYAATRAIEILEWFRAK